MAKHLSARLHRPLFARHFIRTLLRLEFLEDRIVPASTTDVGNAQLFAVDPSQYRSDDILVRFRSDVQVSALVSSQFIAGTEIGDEIAPAYSFYQIHLSAGESVSAALAAYQANPLVVYAQPDYQVHLQSIPNAPQVSTQWDLNNTGQNGGTPGDDISAELAWDTTTGSGKTVVAIIDTGVDYNHQDLYDNIWINQAEIPVSRRANLTDV